MSDRPVVRRLGFVLGVLLAGVTAWGLIAGEPGEADRAAALGSRIRCPVCQGESIADSPAGYARDMMAFVEERVAAGWSDEQILDHLERRFAGIRLDPPWAGRTLLLWLAPLAVAGAGAALVIRRLRRPPEKPPPPPAGDSDG